MKGGRSILRPGWADARPGDVLTFEDPDTRSGRVAASEVRTSVNVVTLTDGREVRVWREGPSPILGIRRPFPGDTREDCATIRVDVGARQSWAAEARVGYHRHTGADLVVTSPGRPASYVRTNGIEGGIALGSAILRYAVGRALTWATSGPLGAAADRADRIASVLRMLREDLAWACEVLDRAVTAADKAREAGALLSDLRGTDADA